MSRKIDSPPAAPAAPAGVSLRERAEAAFQANLAGSSAPPEDLSPEALQRTLHDLQVHHIELEMQNEELRRAQLELEASRARWFDLYDLAPVGYCTVNEAGLIRQANLCSASLLGRIAAALIGQPISRFIFAEDQDRYYLLRSACC